MEKSLNPLQIQTEEKINDYKSGKKKLKKVSLKICLTGLNNRLLKLKKKEDYLQGCLDKQTIPKVIFGGRKNFYQRMKGKITNQEWKELRSNELYS